MIEVEKLIGLTLPPTYTLKLVLHVGFGVCFRLFCCCCLFVWGLFLFVVLFVVFFVFVFCCLFVFLLLFFFVVVVVFGGRGSFNCYNKRTRDDIRN